jgi:hypothetical protein
VRAVGREASCVRRAVPLVAFKALKAGTGLGA